MEVKDRLCESRVEPLLRVLCENSLRPWRLRRFFNAEDAKRKLAKGRKGKTFHSNSATLDSHILLQMSVFQVAIDTLVRRFAAQMMNTAPAQIMALFYFVEWMMPALHQRFRGCFA